MLDGMLDSVKGCLKEEIRMDIISNNLANLSVIGFKKDTVSFKELLDQAQAAGGRAGTFQPGPLDASLISVRTDLSQGDIRATGDHLDLAISGKGFFQVEAPQGIRYTRRGNFRLNSEGLLTTQEGYPVLGKGGPLNLSGSTINIDEKGVISVDGAAVDQLNVIDFEKPENLLKEGEGFFRNGANEPGGPLPPETKIKQGYIELSNVNAAMEMVDMIHSLRAFESYQKAIQVLDGINNKVINQVSRLR